MALMDEDPRMPAFRTAKFRPLHCRMVVREADLHDSAVYNEALSILGIEYSLVVNLDEDFGMTRYLGFTRERTRDPFDVSDCALLAEMIPHLRRALSIRSELERLNREHSVATETLNQLPVGVLVVDQSCRVRGINTTARDVIANGTGIRLIDGCVSAADGGDHSRLIGAIRRAVGAEEERPTPDEVVSLNAAKGGEPLGVLVSGLSAGRLRRGLHVAEDELVTLLTNDPAVWRQKHRDWLRRLYGLTPSQSRLAGLLARGASLKEAARQLSITEGSARQYLKIIFRKTGTNRQADLVRRLNAVPMGALGSADTARRDAALW